VKRIEESTEYEARDPYRSSVSDFGFTQITAANIVEAAERVMSDFRDHRPPERLTSIACPTLVVVHGELDPIPMESSRFIADAIPGPSSS
jgi:pimeloyl-ACP methyl ester carboxylesterase